MFPDFDYVLTLEEANKLNVDKPPSLGGYYRCCNCKHKLIYKEKRFIDYKFCPYCGKSLYDKN